MHISYFLRYIRIHPRQQQILGGVTAFCLFLLFICSVSAQITYPPSQGCDQTPNTVIEHSGPSLVEFQDKVYMAYDNYVSGSGDEEIVVATSTNGTTFSGPTATGVSLGSVYFTPAITVYNGYLYIAFNSGGGIGIITSNNGQTWSTPTYLGLPYPVASGQQVSIFGSGNYVYISYVASTPSGPNVIVGYSSGGTSFSDFQTAGTYAPASGPTVTSFNSNIAVVYTTGSSGVPIVSIFSTPDSQGGFTNISTVNSGAVEFADAPGAVEYDDYLFIFGHSVFQAEDNVWATATPDGSTFETAYEYGMVFSSTPSVTLFNGNIIMAARSKYDNNIWACQLNY